MNHLSDILVHQVVRFEFLVCTQAVALFLCFDDGYVGVGFPLEPLVLTRIAAVSCCVDDTFEASNAVETVVSAGIVYAVIFETTELVSTKVRWGVAEAIALFKITYATPAYTRSLEARNLLRPCFWSRRGSLQ